MPTFERVVSSPVDCSIEGSDLPFFAFVGDVLSRQGSIGAQRWTILQDEVSVGADFGFSADHT